MGFKLKAVLMIVLLLTASMSQASESDALSQVRQMIQLAEYIGVDYEEAVVDGKIINMGEYTEMQEFSTLLVESTRQLMTKTKGAEQLVKQAEGLKKAVDRKATLAEIREAAMQLKSSLLTFMPQTSLPSRLLPRDAVTVLYNTNCSNCHGESGQGDGPLALQLEPKPTDFTDRARAMNRSILGLYESISEGIADTSMPSFTHLSAQERWSLAFYVGGLAFQQNKAVEAALPVSIDLIQLAFETPDQLISSRPDLTAPTIESLRANPEPLFAKQADPIAISKQQLEAALMMYRRQAFEEASRLAVSAYLDGFELAENSIDTRDNALRKSIESNMMKLRREITQANNEQSVAKVVSELLQQLSDAERLLTDTSLSKSALFSASLIILLREGLEALLVILVITTVLIKAGRKDAIKYVHVGWLTALVAGVGTWAIAEYFIDISGASREIMEGTAALLAAVVLFWVGIWMHSKTHAVNWQIYIQKNIDSHLQSGTLWGLTALSFVAVYREVFETVLFYQALLVQAVASQQSVVLSGFLLGIVLLVGLAWLLYRYSIKLPITKFFAVTTYLLLLLSFVLIGKGIMALQEAAIIGNSPLPWTFEIDWIGLKSTWQGLIAQLSVVIIFLLFMFRTNGKARAG